MTTSFGFHTPQSLIIFVEYKNGGHALVWAKARQRRAHPKAKKVNLT
jgi:hypothetical protein